MDQDRLPLKLKTGVSYAIILDEWNIQASEIIFNDLTHRNLLEGYNLGESIVNKYFVISNEDKPDKNKFVISRVYRKEKSIQNIKVEELGVNLILGLFDIEDQSIIGYVFRYMSRKPLLSLYKYLRNVKANDLDFTKFKELVKSRKYDSNYTYKDKVLITIKAISLGTTTSVIEFRKMVESEDMTLDGVVNFMLYCINGDLPKYIEEAINDYKNHEFNRKKEILLAKLIDIDSVERLILFLLNQKGV